MTSAPSARQEWAAMWPLPLVATWGIAGSATFAYSSGVFMQTMTGEFGWSRAEFSSLFMVQTLLGLIVSPLVGRLIDRVGPRRIGLIGIFLFAGGLSSLGFANGARLQWWFLGAVQTICTAFIAPPVWISAVVPRFRVSRGMALAVALAGIGIATGLWPILAALGIESIGWRATFPALAFGWALVMLPIAWVWVVDPPAAPVPVAGASPAASRSHFFRALRTRTFLCVTLAGGLFAGVSYGLILNIVPLLHERGLTLAAAAGMTSVMGVFVIIGRLATGFLLDRLPTRPLGIVIFLLPAIVCLLLWQGAGGVPVAVISVALLGLATGSETDVVVFIIARRFGRDVFASVYGSVSACFAVLAGVGPLLAGAIYDADKSYDRYLLVAIPLVLLAVILIALVPTAPLPEESGKTVTSPHNGEMA